MFLPTRGKGAALALTAVAVTLSMAACGGTNSDGGTSGNNGASDTTVDKALADKVPAAIKADGKILVGSDTTYAPSEFLDTDGKTAIGFDVDLFKAVAAKLGLKAEFQTATFGDIIPGVTTSGKYEIGVSSFTVNPERLAQANMVTYYSAGTHWLTKKGNPAGIKPDEACGKKIAVQKDTVQVDDITARSKKCTDAGKAAITIDPYPAQSDATNAVVSGKDDAMLADSPVIAYAVKQTNGQLETLGQIYDSAPYGYAISKDQTAFAEAVRDAVKALIADGTYQKILEKWNVQAGAIANPELNPKLDGAATPSASPSS
ncbi:ABC transporter substrate-binding protein [Planosporangium flavigriseum]|uniref:ABC transporter substrate-binding protein n=1 Tax=Planosporangium flavigriseum TaxID=373681 RepID=A0A8J3PMX1_9ACTN|nr:ABC transporter substrate-binding protein [Planosporangium flavigriseum]NJC65285.1 ABC transporter substrate-binding protein [Planosporangium flavigriseum]GIG73361.1 ABC transporter substrate-binding protein [Planosporangium flavigriseum]